jgi:hypothetical protein
VDELGPSFRCEADQPLREREVRSVPERFQVCIEQVHGGLVGSMQVWRPPASGRWIALAIGQADAEWPLQLLAAFGEGSVLPG